MKKFLVTIFLLSITSAAFSQEYNELLSKKVSLEKPSYIIRDLLIHINDIPDINIVYNGNDKVLDTTIEIPIGTYTLKEILTRICKTVPYEFLRKNGHVIFKKKNLLEKYEIKGKIIDKKTNNSLEGANMYIPDVNQGSSSNLKGEFSFILTPGKYTIVCSYIGYTTETIDINLYDNKVIDIYLNPTNQNLQEVKTFANRSYYADLDKGRTIQIIPPKEIEKVVSNNASDLLHARLKGVWATKTSGAPGDHQRIRIRGINSIFGNVDPLYVVDGVPVPNVNLNSLGIADLNVRDIETVTVLKDASSTVLYGFQGVNGVILIDTKRGGEKKIEFQTIQGFQWLNTRYPLMHTKDFLGTYKLSDSLLNTTYYKNKFPIWARYPVYNDTVHDNTDMQDLLFTHGQSQEYQLNVQGNVLGINYYISGNYLQHKGVVKNTQYNRYTFTGNFDRKIGKKLNLNFLYRTSYQENKNNLENYLGNTDIFQTLRIEPAYYTTPDTFLTKGARFHYPYNLLGYPVDPEKRLHENNRLNTIFNNTILGALEYHILPNLLFKAEYAISLKKYNYTSDLKLSGRLMESSEKYRVISQQYHLQYAKKFVNHGLKAVASWRNYGDNLTWTIETAKGVELSNITPKDDIYVRGSMALFGETGDVTRIVNSILGHINYNYKEKYFLSIAANYEYLNEGFNVKINNLFSSVALNWDLAKEIGLKELKKLDHLNVYTNWGNSGNYPLNSLSNDLYNSASYSYGNEITEGNYINNLANRDLVHENVTEWNHGVELSMWKGRFIFNIDWFSKKHENLIVHRDIPYYYGGGYIYINIAEMKNKGIEFSVDMVPVNTKNFSWASSFNFSQNNQKITRLDNDSVLYFNSTDELHPDFKIVENQRLGLITGYKYMGLWTEADDTLGDPFVGERSGIKYYNGDTIQKELNADDKVAIGSSLPKFYWNWNNTFTYKNFSIDMLWYCVFGVDKYNATKAVTYISGTNAEVNPIIADTMRYHKDRIFYESSYFVEDASFIRLKTLSFSYTPTKELFKNVRAKFTLSFENLITLSRYTGYDPEASIYTDNNFSDNAIDRGSFPNPKSVYFTIKLSL